MENEAFLIKKAKQITKTNRMSYLMSLKENEIHRWLEKLFSRMDKEAIVQITHGNMEFGADLVIVRKDTFVKIVTAVVVKVGDIKGETSGDVDNIASQIDQCFTIPHEIQIKIDSLNVNEVWLVLVGELSVNARKKLKWQVKEKYKTILNIFEIDWLVEYFTKYVPEIFLGGEAVSFIGNEIEKIETSQSLSKKATTLNLSEWFVEPYMLTGGIPVVLDDTQHRLNVNPEKIKFTNIRSLLKKEDMIIISGDPGIGKTTALSKLRLDILREKMSLVIGDKKQEKIKIPIMIEAKELVDCANYEELIGKCVDLGKLTDEFEIETLIIDGLDEVPLVSREKIMDLSSKVCKNFDCGLIIGTRKIDTIKHPPKGVKNYELASFEISQAIHLIEKIVKDNSLLNTLKEGLSKISSQLPMTPVALILLIDIAEEEGEVPASLCDLYNRYFEMALGKWDIRDKDLKFLFQYEVKIHFLSQLAYVEFYNKDRLEISKKEFEEFINYYANTYGIDHKQIINFFNEIERAGLLIIRDNVCFRHRSFLDYFVALSIYNNQDLIEDMDQFIIGLYFGERWEDIAFYFIGLKKKMTTKLVDGLFAYPGDNFNIIASKYIVGRLLQAGWLTEVDIKVNAILKTLDYASLLKSKINKALEKNRESVGLIFSDFFLFITAGWSLGSITLLPALIEAYELLEDENNKEALQKLLIVFFTLQRYIVLQKREEIVNTVLNKISNSEEYNTEEKSRILLLLVLIEDRLGTLKSTIHRRCVRLARNNSELFKKLLPPYQQPRVYRKKRKK